MKRAPYLADGVPVYSHSMLEQWEACPFAGGAALKYAASQQEDHPAFTAYMQQYLERLPTDDWCEQVIVPIPSHSFVSLQGSAFHEFAAQYGRHLLEAGVRRDTDYAQQLAAGKAVIDGTLRPRALEMMTTWADNWDFDPRAAEAAFTDRSPFESEWRVTLRDTERPIEYVWHPDFALLYNAKHRREVDADGTPYAPDTLVIRDYKTSVACGQFDPYKPDRQLARYALGFWRLFPELKTARLEKHWVNPDCMDENRQRALPFVWELDLTAEFALDLDELILGPIEAIRAETEFAPNPGCWLCPFCDWARDCPAEQEVTKLMGQGPREARDAYVLHEALGRVATAIGEKRRALRRQMQEHVKAHGPLELSEGRTYGPREREVVRVTSASRLLASVRERGEDADKYVNLVPSKLAGARRVLDDLEGQHNRNFVLLETRGRDDISPLILEADDPFLPEGAPALEGVKVLLKEQWGTWEEEAEGDDEHDNATNQEATE